MGDYDPVLAKKLDTALAAAAAIRRDLAIIIAGLSVFLGCMIGLYAFVVSWKLGI